MEATRSSLSFRGHTLRDVEHTILASGDIRLPNGEAPDVTIIVVNYNTAHLLDRLFASIEAARGNLALQIIVIDNASVDGSRDLLRRRNDGIELIENSTNVGFGRANNQAVPRAHGRYLLLLNPDAFMTPDTLRKTIDFMDSNRRCGVLGVKLVGNEGAAQPSGRSFPTPWNVFATSSKAVTWIQKTLFQNAPFVGNSDETSIRQCDWVQGCYYLVRREVVEQLGLFDPRFFFYYEEIDHCRKVKQAGWDVVVYPHAQVIHLGGESATAKEPIKANRQSSNMQVESELLYFRKHYGVSGALAGVLLGTIGGMISTLKGLVFWDTPRVAGAVQRIGTQFRLLFATRLGARPTR